MQVVGLFSWFATLMCSVHYVKHLVIRLVDHWGLGVNDTKENTLAILGVLTEKNFSDAKVSVCLSKKNYLYAR